MNVTIHSHFRSESWTGDVPDELLNTSTPLTTLESLFRLFNRVEAGDGLRLEAWGYRLPSLSVGDTVTIDDRSYLVEPIGFVEQTEASTFTSDDKAAAVHRAQANRHYDAAEHFRKLGMTKSESDARAAARHEDETAELLEARTHTNERTQ